MQVPLQASKWLKIQALLDTSEAASLFAALGTFTLYVHGAVCKTDETIVSQEQFLTLYTTYIEALKSGTLVDLSPFRSRFSLLLTRDSQAAYTVPVSEDQCIVRCCEPAILVQPHQLSYSAEEKKFRSMMFGTESIPWGLQFAWPQLFQNPNTGDVEQVDKRSPNAQLFQALQHWTRASTLPTPFFVEGVRHNVPMRLGRQCLPWINQHAHLKQQGIMVHV
jgi:hypothetical protein